MNYSFCSNVTIVHLLPMKWEKNSSIKWIIPLNSWITLGTERVIQLFIEIIHSIDEREKRNVIFAMDEMSLNRTEGGWICD